MSAEIPELRRIALFRAASLNLRLEDEREAAFLLPGHVYPVHNEAQHLSILTSSSLPSSPSRLRGFETSSLPTSPARSRSRRQLGGDGNTPSLLAQLVAARVLQGGASVVAATRIIRQQSIITQGGTLRRQSSLIVRERAAQHLEETHLQLANSRLLFLGVLFWNIACIWCITLAYPLSWKESTNQPLRLWLGGYSIQCALHIWRLVSQRRRAATFRMDETPPGSPVFVLSGGSSPAARDSPPFPASPAPESGPHPQQIIPWDVPLPRALKILVETFTRSHYQWDLLRPLLSFVWWVMGLSWLATTELALERSPLLYWLCLFLLASDAFYVCFCMSISFLIGIAVCFYLPGVISMLQRVADKGEGAHDDDIRALPIFVFKWSDPEESQGRKKEGQEEPRWGQLKARERAGVVKRIIAEEDAECCICLEVYEDDAEVREIPCRHHYHMHCIDSWLKINATCPLCKTSLPSERAKNDCCENV